MEVAFEGPRCSARWCTPSVESLRKLVDAIYRKRRRAPWSTYPFDNRETPEKRADELNSALSFYPLRLTSLQHFRIADDRVVMDYNYRFQPLMLESVVELLRILVEHAKGISCTFDLDQKSVGGEFSIGLQGRMSANTWTFSIHISDNRRHFDQDTRLRFFENAIAQLELDHALKLVRDPQAYRLAITPPWQLFVNGTNAKGENPSSFHVKPYGSFESAWTYVERLLMGPTVERIVSVTLSCLLNTEHYGSIYKRLNHFSSQWRIRVDGSYADGIDPYTADASQSPDGRFPIIVWSNDQDPAETFFEADVVPTPQGRFLEIHSNCGDLATLLKEAKMVTGETFEPVMTTHR